MRRRSARGHLAWAVWRGRLGTARGLILQAVVEAAAESGQQAYLVGGTVRDLLLGLRPKDLDVAVAGDALEVARRAGETLCARVETHADFGTAAVISPEGDRVDLARTRREHYTGPGAGPSGIVPAPLLEDLWRRDFTVNAMALGLGRARGRGLIDPSGGLADLRLRRLRILHDRSFHDDPTRALRAARLAARLGCRLDPATARSLAAAVCADVFRAVPAASLAREVGRLLEEPRFAVAALTLRHWGAGASLHPDLLLQGEPAACALRLQSLLLEQTSAQALSPAVRRAIALAALALAVPPGTRERVVARLAREEHAGAALAAIDAGMALRVRLGPAGLESRRARGLWMRAEPGARLLAEAMEPDPGLRAALGGARRAIDGLRLLVHGRDLVAAGIPPGPEIRHRLEHVRAARLAGDVLPSHDAELAWALRNPILPAED